jgi:hypothetical protein
VTSSLRSVLDVVDQLVAERAAVGTELRRFVSA